MDDDGDDGDDAASLELITSSPVSHGLLSDSFFFFCHDNPQSSSCLEKPDSHCIFPGFVLLISILHTNKKAHNGTLCRSCGVCVFIVFFLNDLFCASVCCWFFLLLSDLYFTHLTGLV